ncbi:hypothetical protein LRS05_16925 [Flavobacterium sp. J372]|uniref:hypothetical protein n=1 Tax=Flavobacterium sp. J372 TaxID=2898436 RepID=UPI0021512CCF|nr:hypothetical protein [Flavobacterium sp. J372]MCR5861277.1 hypothetical protein [Flavobacterium sp. J372]MCR5863669.1 hypothetical protein [Flavobacterium sp. J372]
MKKIYLYFALVFATTLFAQIPQGFSYQAVALNSNGTAVASAPVNVRLSILDNSAMGTAVYTETHNPTTNSMGLYTLTIGQGVAVTGTFSQINWGQNSKFIKVEIDINNGTDYTTVGTSQLLSVPYAMIAGSIAPESSPKSVSLDNGSAAILTSTGVHVFAPSHTGGSTSSEAGWKSQTISGNPLAIIGSKYSVGALTSTHAYVFGPAYSGGNSSSQNSWKSKALTGTPLKITGTNGVIGIVTSSTAYAYGPSYMGGSTSSQNMWATKTLSGEVIDIVSANGYIGVLTTTNAYVFAPAYAGGSSSSETMWHTQPLTGTPLRIMAVNGMVLVQTTTRGYAFGASFPGGSVPSENNWFTKTITGTPFGITE